MAGRRTQQQRETNVKKGSSRSSHGAADPHPASGTGRRRLGRQADSSITLPEGVSLPLLRTSERTTYKKCEFLWWLIYENKLQPQTEMPALRFGSLVHKALAAYYVPGVKRGVHPARAFEKAYEEDAKHNSEIFGMRVDEEDRWVNALELGVAMLENYVSEYGKDDRWEVLVTEMPFRVLVSHEVRIDAWPHSKVVPWFWYTGVLDGVWRDRMDKTLWIPDHKTTAGIGDSKLKYLQVDDQAGAYWSWGVQFLREQGMLGPKQQLNGMMYNFLRKALPDERASKIVNGKRVYVNLDGSISKKQPSPYFLRQPIFRDEFDRAEAQRRSLIDQHRLELLRSGELEISKNPGMFTCPTCSMRDVCELHETGNDWKTFLKQTTKPWDPYAEHEVYDGR